jgi:phage baseplate assembly protein W
MTRNTRIFSDIDLNFTAHPVTKDITRRFDENAVKSSLKNLVLTSNYERPFHSEIGSPVRSLMFEPFSPMFVAAMKKAIIDMIDNFEPRVAVTDVLINYLPDNNAIEVTIEFTIVNTEKPLTLGIVLERTR